MSDTDRLKCRKIQDAFLKHPSIVREIESKGWNSYIAWAGESPTYAEVRDMIHLAWVPWMIDFLRNEE